MTPTFYWYDLETFGRDSSYDKIAQFAGIRTDYDLNIVGEELVIYNKITPDYLPEPSACLITGITPQETLKRGMTEYDFTVRIREEFMREQTCVCGYNNIRFDDEFIRNYLYRNFFDPYEREYKHGNSRWDLIDVLRMTRDLRPDGIVWPDNEEGRPLFKLEVLSDANGIKHEHKHDALSDVMATIGMARKVKEINPRLFQWAFRLRDKFFVKKQLDLLNKTPLYHTSVMFTRPEGCTTMIAPLSVHPVNKNLIICLDLRADPELLLDLTVEEIRYRAFTPAAKLPEGMERIPLKGLSVNKSPMIAPLNIIEEDRAAALDIDKEQCLAHLAKLRRFPELLQKMSKVYEEGEERPDGLDDPDFQLYSGGFFSDEDRQIFKEIHLTKPEHLAEKRFNFEDKRLPRMLARFRARNYPGTMTPREIQGWKNFCAQRLEISKKEDHMDFRKYQRIMGELTKENLTEKDDRVRNRNGAILDQLNAYGTWLKEKALSFDDVSKEKNE